jgi:hypothetical protein
VFRAPVSPKTRAQAEAMVERSSDVAWAPLTPIGSDNTDAGRAVYAPGDRHAVISGNPYGQVTVCIARGPEPASAVECRDLPVVQEVPDVPQAAPHGVGVTPVIFADGDRGKPAR